MQKPVKNPKTSIIPMKLPWNKKQEKIEQLQQEKNQLQDKLECLKQEKNSFKNRYEAEKERRSKISSEKQEAEKKLKKMRQKNKKDSPENGKNAESKNSDIQSLSLEEAESILKKLDSVNSPKEDLVTVYSPNNLNQVSDLQGLKGSISKQAYNFLSDDKEFAAFIDDEIFNIKLKTRAFFETSWQRSESFDVSSILSFISERKVWVAVSAGDTTVFDEEDGEILSREKISTRVNSKQKKGGFSQGRFERKRQEQIEEHLDLVRENISEDAFLVGEKSLCKKLPGTYLGGFDGDRAEIDSLYNFRLEIKK